MPPKRRFYNWELAEKTAIQRRLESDTMKNALELIGSGPNDILVTQILALSFRAAVLDELESYNQEIVKKATAAVLSRLRKMEKG